MAGGMMWVMGLYSDGLCEDFVGTISGLNKWEELIKEKFKNRICCQKEGKFFAFDFGILRTFFGSFLAIHH